MIQIGNIVLEDKCPDCGGKGHYGDYWEADERPCGTCNKTGVVITSDGEALKDFIIKYVKVSQVMT